MRKYCNKLIKLKGATTESNNVVTQHDDEYHAQPQQDHVVLGDDPDPNPDPDGIGNENVSQTEVTEVESCK